MEEDQGSSKERYIKNTENFRFHEEANGHSEFQNGW